MSLSFIFLKISTIFDVWSSLSCWHPSLHSIIRAVNVSCDRRFRLVVQRLFIRLNNLSTEAVLEGISNYDKVSNRRQTVRWLPDKRTANSNDSIDWTRWIIKPDINRARGYTQLYDFLCSLAESWVLLRNFRSFWEKIRTPIGIFSDADWEFGNFRSIGKVPFTGTL